MSCVGRHERDLRGDDLIINVLADGHCTCKLYADDIKLYSVINSADDLLALQEKINKLSEWSNTWQLKISHKKCCAMLICKTGCDNELKLNDVPIEFVNECRDLGDTIDHTLRFTSHINNICAKASSLVYELI